MRSVRRHDGTMPPPLVKRSFTHVRPNGTRCTTRSCSGWSPRSRERRIEMQNLLMKMESLEAKVDFNDRRVRGFEQVLHTAKPASRPPDQPVSDAPAVATPDGVAAGSEGTSESSRRRRRRRRGRRGTVSGGEGGVAGSDAGRATADVETDADADSDTDAGDLESSESEETAAATTEGGRSTSLEPAHAFSLLQPVERHPPIDSPAAETREPEGGSAPSPAPVTTHASPRRAGSAGAGRSCRPRASRSVTATTTAVVASPDVPENHTRWQDRRSWQSSCSDTAPTSTAARNCTRVTSPSTLRRTRTSGSSRPVPATTSRGATSFHPASSRCNGIPVERFPVARERTAHSSSSAGVRRTSSRKSIPSMTSSAGLIAKGRSARGYWPVSNAMLTSSTSCCVFSLRYHSGFHGARAVAERAILVPTMEREASLGLAVFPPVLRGVRAIMYNSFEERALIHALAGNQHVPGVVVGVGSEIPTAPRRRARATQVRPAQQVHRVRGTNRCEQRVRRALSALSRRIYGWVISR